MLPLSQSWRIDGLFRISPVTIPASYFTSALHPADATALGSYPPNMDKGLPDFSIQPF
jgi:hypothetical protein